MLTIPKANGKIDSNIYAKLDQEAMAREWYHKKYFWKGQITHLTANQVVVSCGGHTWTGSRSIFNKEWA